MESVGGGRECWLELHWQPDRLVVRCWAGVCVCVYYCVRTRVPAWELEIVKLVSVSLSANLWMFAGC